MKTCYVANRNTGILILLLWLWLVLPVEVLAGPFSGSSANVGTDWTSTNKSISTTGDVTADDITATGKITPSAEGVNYNSGDTNSTDTTIEAKLQVQLVADSDYTSLALAVSNIGSTVPTKLLICNDNVMADGTTITFTSNITPDFTCGGSVDGVAGGGTETLVVEGSMVADTSHQIFGDNLGTVTINDPGIVRDPRWMGAVADQTTSDLTAWRRLFASFTARGGSFYAPDGSYLGNAAGIQITWPNDGTNCYPIQVLGSNDLPVYGVFSTYGRNQVKYDGSGTLFDCRNGDDSTLNWMGSIKGVAFTGTNPATAGTYGLYVYDMTRGSITDSVFYGFETGVYVARYMYYSSIENSTFAYCRDGLVVNSTGSGVNGSLIAQNRFHLNTRYGLHIVYGGYEVSLGFNWYESNGTYGLLVSNAVQTVLWGGYFEANNTAGPQMYFTSSPFYNSSVEMYGVHTSPSSTRASMYLDDIATLNIFGGELLSYGAAGTAIETTGYNPKGSILGVKWPKEECQIINRSIRDGFIISGQQMPYVATAYSQGKYDAAQTAGTILLNSFLGTNHGNVLGWITTEPGAGSQVTPLAGVTATTVLGDATITFNADPDVIYQGATIEVAGETFEGDAYATVVGFSAAAVAELDKTADVGVAGAAVSYHAAVQKRIHGVELQRTSTDVTITGTTDETTLYTETIGANISGTAGGLHFHAAGVNTGATGTKTFKWYTGATAITLYTSAAGSLEEWIVDVEVYNQGSVSAQLIKWSFKGIDPTTHIPTEKVGIDIAAIDTSASVEYKFTGDLGAAGDSIVGKMGIFGDI